MNVALEIDSEALIRRPRGAHDAASAHDFFAERRVGPGDVNRKDPLGIVGLIGGHLPILGIRRHSVDRDVIALRKIIGEAAVEQSKEPSLMRLADLQIRPFEISEVKRRGDLLVLTLTWEWTELPALLDLDRSPTLRWDHLDDTKAGIPVEVLKWTYRREETDRGTVTLRLTDLDHERG